MIWMAALDRAGQGIGFIVSKPDTSGGARRPGLPDAGGRGPPARAFRYRPAHLRGQAVTTRSGRRCFRAHETDRTMTRLWTDGNFLHRFQLQTISLALPELPPEVSSATMVSRRWVAEGRAVADWVSNASTKAISSSPLATTRWCSGRGGRGKTFSAWRLRLSPFHAEYSRCLAPRSNQPWQILSGFSEFSRTTPASGSGKVEKFPLLHALLPPDVRSHLFLAWRIVGRHHGQRCRDAFGLPSMRR